MTLTDWPAIGREAKGADWPQRWWLELRAGELTLIDTANRTNREDMVRLGLALMVALGCRGWCRLAWRSQRIGRRRRSTNPPTTLRPATNDEVRACREALGR